MQSDKDQYPSDTCRDSTSGSPMLLPYSDFESSNNGDNAAYAYTPPPLGFASRVMADLSDGKFYFYFFYLYISN